MLRAVSGWASRHTSVAIALIILLEITNGYLGTLLGANLLETVPAGALQAAVIALVGVVIYVRLWYQGDDSGPGIRRPRLKRVCMFTLFMGNFLLFTVIGGIGANRVRVFHPSGSVGGSSASVSSVMPGDSLRPTLGQPKPEPSIKLRRKVPLAVLILGYALLLGAGFFLGLLLVLFSCQLSCPGYGLGAVLLTLLGLGVVGGLGLLWGRVISDNIKRIKVPAERSRAARRYRRVWLAAVAAMLATQVLLAG